MAMLPILAHAQKENIASCGPVPTENQLRWQDMEMYAFIHYSLNTYTDQEWGFGNEDPKLFNPSNLDCRQWAHVCKQMLVAKKDLNLLCISRPGIVIILNMVALLMWNISVTSCANC